MVWRPEAPRFAYDLAPNDPYHDVLDAVEYVSLDASQESSPAASSASASNGQGDDEGDSDTVVVALDCSGELAPSCTNASFVGVDAAVWSVPNGQVRGNANVLPLTLSTHALARVYAERNASGVPEAVLVCRGRTDMLAWPSVNVVAEVAEELGFALAANGTLWLSVGDRFTGAVDSDTGLVVGWNESAMQAPSPVVSDVGWLVFNCHRGNFYQLAWYAQMYHDFPRVFGTPSWFVYQTSVSFPEYITAILLGTLPFMAIGALLLVFGPTQVLLRWLWRSCVAVCSRSRHGPRQSELPERADESDGLLGGGRAGAAGEEGRAEGSSGSKARTARSCLCCASQSKDSDDEEGDEEALFSERRNSGGWGARNLARLRRPLMYQLRADILNKRKRLTAVLRPASVRRRLLLLAVLLLASGIVPLGLVSSGRLSEALTTFLNTAAERNESFIIASEVVANRLGVVEAMLDNCSLTDEAAEQMDFEARTLDRLAGMVTERSIAVNRLNYLSSLNAFRNITYVTLSALLAMLMALQFTSLLLTYCTFKWGDERVICTRLSFHLGRSLPVLIGLVSTMTWAVLAGLSLALTLGSDVCANPSFILVNETVADLSSSAAAQAVAMIYSYQQEYVATFLQQPADGPDEPRVSTLRFNVAAMLSSCLYSNTVFNPYSQLAMLASDAHWQVLDSGTTAASLGCGEVAPVAEYTASDFYGEQGFGALSCSAFDAFASATALACEDEGLLQLFLFFTALICYNVLAFILWRSHNEILPGAYRIYLAKELVDDITLQQARLREELCSD